MKVIVTGGAGFIGSHLCDSLLNDGNDVISVDSRNDKDCNNLSTIMNYKHFSHRCFDVNNTEKLIEISKGCDMVFHLAANSDIMTGGNNPAIDYEKTFLTTHSVLEAIRVNKIKKIFFSSTSAIYGEKKGALNENTGNLTPISYYGAAKLASEAMISAYSFMNDFDALVFRFPNVIGPRLTHGVIYDFIRKLKANPSTLYVLGDGHQTKQYVYIDDIIDGITTFSKKMKSGYDLYNVSTESNVDVKTIAELTCARMGLNKTEIKYGADNCGWKGDVPFFEYDIDKAKAAGWKYRYDSVQAVKKTLSEIDFDQISSL